MTAAELRRLRARLAQLEPALRREVERAFASIRTSADVAALEAALARGDEFAIRQVTASLTSRLAAASRLVADAAVVGAQMASLTARLTFRATNPAVIAAAETAAARMVTQVTAETKRAIRAVITDAVSGQLTPRDAAKAIRPLIGLTTRQAKAVTAYRATHTEAQAERYAAKLLRQRAEMIARTEIIRASSDGQIAAWRQAVKEGRLSPNLEKVWIVTDDDKLCPICEALDGQAQPFEGLFVTPRGRVNGPPAHPNCRCAIGAQQARQSRRQVA